MRTIYLNNAATSFPKPAAVVDAMVGALLAAPADGGRGGEGDDPRDACRRELAALLGVDDPTRIALLPSATYALNLVVSGLLPSGSHAVTTMLEHNSVLRPLAHRKRDHAIGLTHVSPDAEGRISPLSVQRALAANTRLVAMTHASNVTGSVQAIEEVAEIAARARVPLLIDAAQSAGTVRIEHRSLPGRVFVAFAGHKGLLGPQGVGGLVVPDAETPQDIVGGTGAQSENPLHPEALPWRHEAGTPNLPGIAGLRAGARWVRAEGVEAQGRQRDALVRLLRERLAEMPEIRLLPLAGEDGRVGLVSFTLDGWSPEDVGFILRDVHGIQVRTGLHCAPLAHEALATAPKGTVRVSFGHENRDDDVAALVEALRSIAES